MKSIDEDIRTGQLKKVYLLYGEEMYLLLQYRNKLKKAAVAEDDTMNFAAYEGKDVNQNEIIDLAETLPFFSERRLILIENSGLFKARGAKKAAVGEESGQKESGAGEESGQKESGAGEESGRKEGGAGEESGRKESGIGEESGWKEGGARQEEREGGDAEAASLEEEQGGDGLAGYLSGMPETTCIIFVEEKPDKRSKLYKAVAKEGRAVEFAPQNEETIQKWMLGRLKREGKSITRQAYQLFIEKTGTDMANIDRELEKLICYTMEKEVIEPEDVAAVTTEQIQNKIFEMVDAISSHQQKRALDLYYDLLALREPPMKILYLVTRQFHILSIVKAMGNQGFGNRDIASKAGCPEWAVRKYQAQSRGYSLEQLKQAVRDGAEYEEEVKTGRLNERMAVELFLIQYSAARKEKITPSA